MSRSALVVGFLFLLSVVVYGAGAQESSPTTGQPPEGPPPSGSPAPGSGEAPQGCPPDESDCGPPPDGDGPPPACPVEQPDCQPPDGGPPCGGDPDVPCDGYPCPQDENGNCLPPPQGEYRQACSPDGYCPPPAQMDCPPEDQYCRPPPSGECQSKMEDVRAEMEGMMQTFQAEMKAFHDAFEQDRKAFGQSSHTPEEWRAWGDAWRTKGQAKGDEFYASLQSFIGSKDLGDCMQFMPPPPMMGGPGGPGGGPGGPPPEQRYAKGPSGDNRFAAEDEEVRKIREECGNQIMALVGPPPEQGGTVPTPEEEQQIRAIMKECEKKIRDHFGGVYKEEFEAPEGENQGANQQFGSFEVFFDESTQSVRVTGKFLALVGNTDSQVMSDITCGGQRFIDQLNVNGFLEDFGFEDTGEGTALAVKASGSTILQLHDNPRCTINLGVGGTINEITMDLADYLDVEETDKGVKFTDGEVDGTVLVHEGDFELGENNKLVFAGKATFLVSNSAGAQASSSSLATDLNVKQALEEGNIGAEVVIVPDEEGGAKADATPYGDLEVAVEVVSEEEVSITVDSDTEEGKTIVMALDDEVLPVEALEDVQVQVYDVAEADAGEVAISSTETEACTREASNLQDVLDPTDDGDCNEYWVVIDKLGTQVLVSNAHYSQKRISIQSSSSGSSVTGNVLLWGVGIAGAVGLVLVGVGIQRRRRPPGQRVEAPTFAPSHAAPSDVHEASDERASEATAATAASPPAHATTIAPASPEPATGPPSTGGDEFVSRIALLRKAGGPPESPSRGKDADKAER